MPSPVSPPHDHHGGLSQETEDESLSPLRKRLLENDKSHKKKKKKRKSESKKKKKKHHHHDGENAPAISPQVDPTGSNVPSDEDDGDGSNEENQPSTKSKAAAASPIKSSGGKLAAAKSKYDSNGGAKKRSKKGPPPPPRVAEPEEEEKEETTTISNKKEAKKSDETNAASSDGDKSINQEDGVASKGTHQRGGRYPSPEYRLLKALDNWVIEHLMEKGYSEGDHPIPKEAFPTLNDIITAFQEKYEAKSRITQKDRVQTMAERLEHLQSCASSDREQSTEPLKMWMDEHIKREAKALYDEVEKDSITAKGFFALLSEKKRCYLTDRAKKMLQKTVLELPDDDDDDEQDGSSAQNDAQDKAAKKSTTSKKDAKASTEKAVAKKSVETAPPKSSQDTETEESEGEEDKEKSKGKRKGSEEKEGAKPPPKRARSNSTSSGAKTLSAILKASSPLETKLQDMKKMWEKSMATREKEREAIESKMNRWKDLTRKDHENIEEQMVKLQAEIKKAQNSSGVAKTSSNGDKKALLGSVRDEMKVNKKEIAELKKKNKHQIDVINSQKTEIENLKRLLKEARGGSNK